MRTPKIRVFCLIALLAGLFLSGAMPAAASQASRHREADALALKAYNRMDRGDLEGAITNFRAAHRLNPGDAAINSHLAELLTATGITLYHNHRNASAAARFQEALSVEPHFGRAHEYLSKVQFIQFYAQGNQLYAAGKPDAALRKFTQAVAAAPEHKDARIKLNTIEADLLIRQATHTSLESAVAKRKTAAKLAPEDAGLQQKLKDSETALAIFEALKN